MRETTDDNARNNATRVREVSRIRLTLGALIAFAMAAVLPVGAGEAVAATVYENGDSGYVARWRVAARSSSQVAVRRISDAGRSGKVISLKGNLSDAFQIGGGGKRWNNRSDRMLLWSMRTSTPFAAYALLYTEHGDRVIRYTNAASSRLGYKPRYIDYGLGRAAMNGRWQTHARDLQADLAAAEPGNLIVAVHGFLFRGTALIDDLALDRSAASASPVVGSTTASPSSSPSSSGGASAKVVATDYRISDSEISPSRKIAAEPSVPTSGSTSLPSRSGGRQLAFPGAEGHGRFATGGRGGRVVIVDTRADVVSSSDGRTSLREALETMSGPRMVVFAVGGTFDIGNKLILMSGQGDSKVTVACQTAPKPGVLIRGNGIRIRGGADNIIMRHCAIRNIDPGRGAADSSRALAVVASGNPTGDMIFDHMSLGWATDENFTAFVGPKAAADLKNITLSRSIVAEGDADSNHSESGQLQNRYLHSMGPSCSSSSSRHMVIGCSIVGNLIAHNGRRNPMMWGTTGEVINNVIYNWQETALDASPRSARLELYVKGNEFKAGPTTRRDKPAMRTPESGSKVKLKVDSNSYLDPRSGVRQELAGKSVGSPALGASSVAGFDLGCVGASRPQRSDFDARVAAEYQNGTGQTGIESNHRRNFSGYGNASYPASHDTDRDGMADAWETREGLNPNDSSDHAKDQDGDGFTNIEEYVNALGSC